MQILPYSKSDVSSIKKLVASSIKKSALRIRKDKPFFPHVLSLYKCTRSGSRYAIFCIINAYAQFYLSFYLTILINIYFNLFINIFLFNIIKEFFLHNYCAITRVIQLTLVITSNILFLAFRNKFPFFD